MGMGMGVQASVEFRGIACLIDLIHPFFPLPIPVPFPFGKGMYVYYVSTNVHTYICMYRT